MESEQKTKTILKVLVGSQAHGLATENSDFDYRGVFLVPTEDLLKLGGVKDQTSWIEGKDDDTSWELHKFLFLATKSNPTILETFLSPRIDKPEDYGLDSIDGYYADEYFLGDELRGLFADVWNSNDVKNAFIGYGRNQRKKFFDDIEALYKDPLAKVRMPKYAAAYLRVLYNAYQLLSTGTFTVKIADTEVGEQVRRFKNGEFEPDEVIKACLHWEKKVNEAFMVNPHKLTDSIAIDKFLIKTRKGYWSF